MKNVMIIGILAVPCVLAGCRSTPNPQVSTPPATTAQAAAAQPDTPQPGALQPVAPQSPIDLIRNGYLKSYKTTTIGQAIDGTFRNGEWKTFKSEKGVTVVEFDAAGRNDEYCKSDAGKAAFSQGQASDQNPSGYTDCMVALGKQHSNNAVNVVIQFTINHDGTFQYLANNVGLSAADLFSVIYN